MFLEEKRECSQIPGAVQGTNDCSIVSKLSAASAGYFSDDYLSVFVPQKLRRRAPLINRGYYIRFQAVSDSFRWFAESAAGPVQVVSLGAGFDTAYFRTRGLFEQATFFEVDFPELVARKAELICANSGLCCAFGPFATAAGPCRLLSRDYRLIGADLRDVAGLEKSLRDSGLDDSLPTLLLSECVLTYMEPAHATAVIEWAARAFTHAAFLAYEQIHPFDTFGRFMRKHFDKLQSPLRGITAYPDCKAQERRYASAGFDCASSCTMLHYFRKLDATERQRIQRIEPFDEYEEWLLKCGHYMIVVATKGALTARSTQLTPPEVSPSSAVQHQLAVATDCSTSVPAPAPAVASTSVVCSHVRLPWSAYGHCTAPVSGTSFVLTLGGFGSVAGRHSKLSTASVVDCRTGEVFEVDIRCDLSPTAVQPGMYGALAAVSCSSVRGGTGLMLFGGRHSPLCPRTTGATLLTFDDGGSSLLPGTACPMRWTAQPWPPATASDGCQPPPRWRHTLTSVNVSRRADHIVLFGGRNATEVLGDCYIGSVDVGVWQSADDRRIVPRHSHACCALSGGRLALHGGLDADEKPLSDLWSLDVASRQWTALVFATPLPSRVSHTLHAVADNILAAVGGVDAVSGAFHAGLTLIDTSSCQIVDLALPGAFGDDLFMWHNHCSELVGEGSNTEIHVIGGGGNCFSFGTHLNATAVRVRVADLLDALDGGQQHTDHRI